MSAPEPLPESPKWGPARVALFLAACVAVIAALVILTDRLSIRDRHPATAPATNPK